MRWAATFAVFLAVASPGAAGRALELPSDLVQLGTVETPVYRVTLTVRDGAWSEAVAPVSGQCRRDDGQGHVEIAGARTRAIVDATTGVNVRTGAPDFVFGRLRDRCASQAPLRERLARGEPTPPGTVFAFERNGVSISARIDEELSANEAVERGLFSVPTERLSSYDLERDVGEGRRLPIRVYWFGPAFAGRTATRAIEHFDYFGDPARRNATLVHLVFYQRPGERKGAEPGERNPPGEIQVSSQPIGQRLAQRTVAAINGRNGDLRTRRWSRQRIRLANGERVTVVPARWESTGPVREGFLVLTKRTLVSVVFPVRLADVPRLARQLRPLGTR